jgi:hypothetical protein
VLFVIGSFKLDTFLDMRKIVPGSQFTKREMINIACIELSKTKEIKPAEMIAWFDNDNREFWKRSRLKSNWMDKDYQAIKFEQDLKGKLQLDGGCYWVIIDKSNGNVLDIVLERY